MKKKNRKFEDDGRVIAPMNVEGMPWYNDQIPKVDMDSSLDGSDRNRERKMSKKDNFKMILRIYAIVFPIALLFIVLLALFIVFTGHIWLK